MFPGQLVGVVGPNGCGKSNIIDAVRWVLGESKAAALRGESMHDVIFNGSATRKPIGRASVELVFDNALGKVGGQWAQYAEIAVKRVLQRSGDSSYYINNLHVRRRDVVDIFLGTGLGPRAYAIIEQGMISRIIEAKPEELRVFLEEAAGVSKYKERRRETENRLADARDNLARVEDIRNELAGQIDKLEAQAMVAERYRELHAELAERHNLLWLLKRNDARAQREKLQRDIERGVNRLESETAALRARETELEQARAAHYSASDAVHAAQSETFVANAEVARLEGELQRLREARQKLEHRLGQLTNDESKWREQSAAADADAARWRELEEVARQRAASALERHAAAAERLPEAEQVLQRAQGDAGTARRELAQAEQQMRVEEANGANAGRALESLAARRTRLEQEREELAAPDARALARLTATVGGLKSEAGEHQAQVEVLQNWLPEREEAQRVALERSRGLQNVLTEARARHEALVQLQSRVQRGGELGEWIQRHGLDQAAPLWRALQVEPGWEAALEAVLRERLSALPLEDEGTAAALLGDAAPGTLSVALTAADQIVFPPRAELGEPLLDKVRCSDARWHSLVFDWLHGTYANDDLTPLLARRSELSHAECWVDRAGRVLTRHGIGFYRADEQTHGVIERQREIDELDGRLSALDAEVAGAQETAREAESALAQHRDELAAVRKVAQELQQRLHTTHVEALKLAQAQQRFDERCAGIERDLQEVELAEQNERERQARAEVELGRGRELAEALRARVNALAQAEASAGEALREGRALEQQLARELQEAGFSERECVAKLEEIARARGVAAEQLERIGLELALAKDEQSAIDEPSPAAALQAALALRQEREQALGASRTALEELAEQLRGLDEARLKTEQGLGPLRERIGDLRLKEQAAQLAEEQYAQRLAEGAADEAALAPQLGQATTEAALQEGIAQMQKQIDALGAVNLAALDELSAARERKDYLDAQSADLNQAIATLEDAIRRIDRETREQLQHTYEQVNNQFGQLFPQLFGGGEAKLILTGDEILDAGVQVMAQPPGKKNASIHLLSGGEKALTAIALVFSLFQLNPAPFCMLDEVDAPLDDSNTERFCELVRRMSKQTQFVFISHNKLTMEIAEQLIGVTMQEQGVSHVVEVDIEEALRMREEVAA